MSIVWKKSKYVVSTGRYFSVFGLNIQFEYRKIRTRNNYVFGHFLRSAAWWIEGKMISKNYSNFEDSATDIWFFLYLMCVFGRINCAKFQIASPYRNCIKELFKYCDKLRPWNKQLVVEHCRLVLHNEFLIIIM